MYCYVNKLQTSMFYFIYFIIMKWKRNKIRLKVTVTVDLVSEFVNKLQNGNAGLRINFSATVKQRNFKPGMQEGVISYVNG